MSGRGSLYNFFAIDDCWIWKATRVLYLFRYFYGVCIC